MEYILKNGKYAGLAVTVNKPSPEFLLKMQKVYNSAKMPKRPKYEAKTGKGHIEEHYMDELSAQQTPGGMAKWRAYQEESQAFRVQQNDNVVNALFYFCVECVVPEDGWEDEQMYLGIEVPQQPKQRMVHFLTSELDTDDFSTLTTEIMRQSGMNDELVREAENSFRMAIRDEPGQAGGLENTG